MHSCFGCCAVIAFSWAQLRHVGEPSSRILCILRSRLLQAAFSCFRLSLGLKARNHACATSMFMTRTRPVQVPSLPASALPARKHRGMRTSGTLAESPGRDPNASDEAEEAVDIVSEATPQPERGLEPHPQPEPESQPQARLSRGSAAKRYTCMYVTVCMYVLGQSVAQVAVARGWSPSAQAEVKEALFTSLSPQQSLELW